MSIRSIKFAGHEFRPHPCGSLYWPAEDILIISDLHLEKGSSFVKRGLFLPPYDTTETLEKLQAICEKVQPRTLLFLGDVFHDHKALERMQETDRRILESLISHYKMVWIEGNHDPATAPQGIDVLQDFKIQNIIFRHIAGEDEGFEMSGHYHPCIKFSHKGQKVRRPCFLVSERKLIMPSFGAFTGGLDIHEEALQSVIGPTFKAYAMGHKNVHHVKV